MTDSSLVDSDFCRAEHDLCAAFSEHGFAIPLLAPVMTTTLSNDSRHEILLSSFERLSQPEFTVLLDCHVSQDEAALNLRIKSINLLSLSRSRSRSEMTSITLLSASNLRVEDAMK